MITLLVESPIECPVCKRVLNKGDLMYQSGDFVDCGYCHDHNKKKGNMNLKYLKYLTVREASKLYNVKTGDIYNGIINGLIKTIRLNDKIKYGGTILIKHQHFLKWLEYRKMLDNIKQNKENAKEIKVQSLILYEKLRKEAQ